MRAFIQWDAHARAMRGSAPDLREACFLGLGSDSTPQEIAAALATAASLFFSNEPRQRRLSPLMWIHACHGRFLDLVGRTPR